MPSVTARGADTAVDAPDLRQCESEPIHVPGSIQPHGALLALHGPSLRITQATASCEAVLGRAAGEVLEVELSTAFDASLAEAVLDALARHRAQPDGPASFAWSSPSGDVALAGYVHEVAPLVVLELEPAAADGVAAAPPSDALAQAARASRLVRAQADLSAKAQTAAEWIRRLTGYDRVMVYRFHDDWHGEVVAEARREDLEPYLGLHYPASDIPQQARRLYLVSPTRVIVDVEYTPSPLLPRLNPVTGRALDLSRSVLRSVSPVHLEYLRNMGVEATLVASLLWEGGLWGLVSCHHYRARPISRETREIADWMAQDLATQIGTTELRHCRRRAAHLKRCRDDVVLAMRGGARISDLLHGPGLHDLLGAVGAEGAALVHGDLVTTGGVTPEPARVLQIARRLGAARASEPSNLFVTECLAEHLPEAAGWGETAAGVGMFPLDAAEPIHLVWFRGEQIRNVTWGGNPDKAMNLAFDGRVSPRRSFEAWTESVRLHATPWQEEEVASARELGAMIDLELRRIAEDARRASEDLLREVGDSLTAHVAVLDARGAILTVNEAWRRFASENGGGPSCSAGADYLAVCANAAGGRAEGEAGAALRGIRAVLAGERRYFELEYPCDSPSETRWFAMRVFRLSGVQAGAVVAHENITVAKLAELALRRSEARFRTLFEGHSAVMLLVDPADGALVDVNPAAARFYGYPREALRTMSIGALNLLPREALLEHVANAATTQQNTFLFPHRLAGGDVRMVEVNSSPVEVEGRTLLFSIVHEVTDREGARDALERERRRYLSLLKIAQDGLHVLDEDGVLIEASESFLRMLGLTTDDLGRARVSDWEASFTQEQVDARLAELLLEPGLFQTRHRHRDGTRIDVEVHAGPVELEGRRFVLASSRDITARRELEHRLATKKAQLEELNRSLEDRIQGAVSDLRAKDQLLAVQGRQAAMGRATASYVAEIEARTSKA